MVGDPAGPASYRSAGGGPDEGPPDRLRPVYLHSTGFVLDPEGKVVVAVHSTGAIGRLVPEDVAGLIRYVKEHAAG